jgi:hypothetical protein
MRLAAQRARADQAFQFFQLVRAAYRGETSAGAVGELLAAHGVHNLTRETLARLQPKASERGRTPPNSAFIERLYGINSNEMASARTRAWSGPAAHDGRSILTPTERQLLAQYVGALSDRNLACTRGHAIEVMRDLLSIRHTAREEAKRASAALADSIPPLNRREVAFLTRIEGDRAASRNSQSAPLREWWFLTWEREFGLELVTAKAQEPQRAAAATRARCAAHFKDLGEALQSLGFLHGSGPHAGSIKVEGTLPLVFRGTWPRPCLSSALL